ncbi:oligosaccharide flippase family protein [Bifidobacterium pullorum subsp. saeculare]|uniref:lipopolysaccharide biosynthesis protein n=1 Tax=Bifidobacterium pullorum TaxID=78448 RepID=UPI001957E1DD|nr:oligosaccharide flippase family protein [Bifidobacterium pullorum]MBM6693096.1 oligosaccharide flippase family protein [Bifidobacterium pullorum subsp. saeculare]
MASQRKVGVLLGYTNIVVKNLVNLIYTPMLLHFVGKAEYGVYQSTYAFVFSLTLLTFGFSEAYVRFYMQREANGSKDDIRRLNGMYLLLYIVVVVVVLFLGFLFASNAGRIFARGFTLEQISLSRMLISIMTVNIACMLFSTVFDAFILAHERFRFQQSRQLFTTLAAPVISFALLNLGMNVVAVACAQLVVTFILLVLNMRYAIGSLGMRFDVRHFDFRFFRVVALFSAWIFANQVCELINQNLPNVVLGALSGAAVAAVFAISVQIRSVFYSISGTMTNVFTPLINRIVAEHDDNDILTRLMTRVGRYQALLYMWVWGGFVLLGRFFIREWAGRGFEDAYGLIVIMTAPLFIPLVQNTGIEIQRAKNRHRARSVAYLCMAALNMVLTIALAPLIGYWAPAVGYVAYVVLGCGLFMNWYYHKRIGLDMMYFWRCVAPVPFLTVAVCAICLCGTVAVPISGWGWFIVWGIVYTFFYGFVVYGLVLNRDEREKLNNRIRHFVLLKIRNK